VPNPWRRATLAMMGVMGTAVLGGFTLPLHQAWGTAGLIGLFAVCLAAIGVAWRVFLSAPRE
jgi:hypothetical protein